MTKSESAALIFGAAKTSRSAREKMTRVASAPNTSPTRPPQVFFRSATSASSIARALKAAGRWLIRA
jgi:hypothetical protein